jgi:hypothetical protein
MNVDDGYLVGSFKFSFDGRFYLHPRENPSGMIIMI